MATVATLQTADSEILTPAAQAFLTELHRKFNDRRLALLERRVVRQQEIDEGARRISSPKRARSASPPGPSLPSPPI